MEDLTDVERLVSNFEILKSLLDKKEATLDKKTENDLDSLLSVFKANAEKLTVEKITEIGRSGYPLLQTLFYESYKSDQLRPLYQKCAISFAYWVAVNGGTLEKIDYPVNALAQLSNTLHDKMSLEAMYEVATYFVLATDDQIKKGKSKSQADAWHSLIMNLSIIATRTHNPDLMISAFKSLIEFFPESAPGFFKQGMSEMIRLNYPHHVKSVMQRYFEKYAA